MLLLTITTIDSFVAFVYQALAELRSVLCLFRRRPNDELNTRDSLNDSFENSQPLPTILLHSLLFRWGSINGENTVLNGPAVLIIQGKMSYNNPQKSTLTDLPVFGTGWGKT